MGDLLELKRSISAEVIKSLVKLGYLQRNPGRNVGAVEHALARLQDDLCREQTIRGSSFGPYYSRRESRGGQINPGE